MKKNILQIRLTVMLFMLGFSSFSIAQILEEIVVTATKREVNLQDVPVAISVISQVELNKRGIIETSDLMGSMPNLQVTSAYGTTQPNFSLRGISVANEFSAATASPVGVYVDEVYQSFRASHGQQLYDLEQVEVVRGPQGTLFGRNTTGGAVSFYTKKPELGENNGYLSAGAGNFGSIKFHGAGEVTLVPETFGIRVAGTYNQNDGYTENVFDGEDYAQTDSHAARISARWQVTDNFNANVKVYYSKNSPRQDIAYGIGYLQGESDALGYSRIAANLDEDQIDSDTAGEYFTTSNGISLTLNWDVTDDISITSVTGFDKGKYRLSPFDCDGSPSDMCAIRYLSESDNINQDLRINWDTDRFKFVGGLYYGEDKIDTSNQPDFFGVLQPLLQGAGLPGNFSNVPLATQDALSIIPAFAADPTLDPTDPANCAPVVINPNGFFDATSLIAFQADTAINNLTGLAGGPVQTACGLTTPFAPVLADQFFTLERPSFAIYGEAEIPIFDKFELTLGLRWTKDKVKFKDAQTTIFGLDGVTPVATTVPYSFPFDPTIGTISQSESDSNLSGRIILNYLVNDNMRAYFSFSRGYRAGTYNALAYQGVEQIYYLEPEEVDAFELGFKSRLFDDSVQLNIAAFFYDYTNQQIAQIIGVTSFLRNANGELYGAEAELVAQINDRIRIDGSVGFLESEYKDNEFNPSDPRSLTADINGNPFPNAPDITTTIGADINIWRGRESNSVDLRLDAQYMGEYFFDPFEDYGQSPCDQPVAGSNILLATPELACGNPDYWLFNARLTYRVENFSISAWGKNLTDEFYYLYGLNLNAFNLDYLSRGAPRSYGIDFRYNF